MTTRDELERAVINAAKAWFQTEPRAGLKVLFDPTQAALVKAIVELDNAPEPVAYEDSESDVWYRGQNDMWCLNRHCEDPHDKNHGKTEEHVREFFGPLREVTP